MSKLLATLVAAAFAFASSSTLAQGATSTGAEPTSAEKAKEGMAAAEKSKAGNTAVKPNVHDPNTMKNLQDLNKSSTNSAQAKANVDASNKTPRKGLGNIKDMTPEQREAVRKQTAEQSKP